MFVAGIDIGKTCAMTVVSDEKGNVAGRGVSDYRTGGVSRTRNRNEQNPEIWWNAVVSSLRLALDEFVQKGFRPEDIECVSCDGTSGTVFFADAGGNPLTYALVYDDVRAHDETSLLHEVGRDYENRLGIKFNENYGLPKILWLRKNMPQEYDRASYIMHPTDYIVSKLTGIPGISDYATSLKSGYDIIDGRFSDCVSEIGIDMSKMPEIHTPGQVVGKVSDKASSETGLSVRTKVAAGATDGYASCLASGAVSPGRWSTILGNTFVVKGITEDIVKDPKGRIYCHRHPSGYFMPSGMSNAGGRCLEEEFGIENLKKFDASVLGLIPTNILVYPLTDTGERFPFVCEKAKKFVFGTGREREMYTAHLEGLSYVEKLAFETMEKLGCSIGDDVWAVGGSTRGSAWLKIRATVLKKNLHIPRETTPAMGAAMLAASDTVYTSLEQASNSMLQESMVVEPYGNFVQKYERLYLEFKDKCSALYSVDL